MQSPIPWLALIIFIGLAALMVQRSAMAEPVDRLWQYAPPAIGCAAVNILGNRFPTIAIVMLAAIVCYILLVLRPRRR